MQKVSWYKMTTMIRVLIMHKTPDVILTAAYICMCTCKTANGRQAGKHRHIKLGLCRQPSLCHGCAVWKRIDCVLSGVLVAGWCFRWWNFRAQYTKAEQLGCELFSGSSCRGQIIRWGLPFELARHRSSGRPVMVIKPLHHCQYHFHFLFVSNLSNDIYLPFNIFYSPFGSWTDCGVAQKEDNWICFYIGMQSSGKLMDKSAVKLQMNTSKSYKMRIIAMTPLSRDSITVLGRTNLAESHWTIPVQTENLKCDYSGANKCESTPSFHPSKYFYLKDYFISLNCSNL